MSVNLHEIHDLHETYIEMGSTGARLSMDEMTGTSQFTLHVKEHQRIRITMYEIFI